MVPEPRTFAVDREKAVAWEEAEIQRFFAPDRRILIPLAALIGLVVLLCLWIQSPFAWIVGGIVIVVLLLIPVQDCLIVNGSRGTYDAHDLQIDDDGFSYHFVDKRVL